ncbi:MAG: hypothetical protein WC563_10360 [Brevundimonas sp.]|jgi:hypothetical protein
MTAPSQTPEAAGLSVERRAELYDHMKLVAEANGFKSLTEAIACATSAQARNAEASMLAYKWMEAHDRLKVGLDYDLPSPADVPAEKARADRLAKALEETRSRVREWPIDDHETCMCGSPVASHGMGDGHSPVSQGDHAISMIVEAITEALQQETQK